MLSLYPPPSLKNLSYAPAHERLVHALNVLSNVQKQQQRRQHNDNGTVDELFF